MHVVCAGGESPPARCVGQLLRDNRRSDRHGRSDDDEEEWEERWVLKETHTPELQIDTTDGTVTIGPRISSASGWYNLNYMPHTSTRGDQRISGFQPGDTVMVLGTIQSGEGGMLLVAETLHGGTKATFVDAQHTNANVLFGMGVVVVLGAVGFASWKLLS